MRVRSPEGIWRERLLSWKNEAFILPLTAGEANSCICQGPARTLPPLHSFFLPLLSGDVSMTEHSTLHYSFYVILNLS